SSASRSSRRPVTTTPSGSRHPEESRPESSDSPIFPPPRIATFPAAAMRRVYENAPMLLREVQYARPQTVEEAVGLLAANDGARALAGGQTLVNVMKARAASPDVLVDLQDLDELRGVRDLGGGAVEIGAMTTYAQLVTDEAAGARSILGEVAATIADVQVRNRGTVGGNVCSNDPTNHLPPLLVALHPSFPPLPPP